MLTLTTSPRKLETRTQVVLARRTESPRTPTHADRAGFWMTLLRALSSAAA